MEKGDEWMKVLEDILTLEAVRHCFCNEIKTREKICVCVWMVKIGRCNNFDGFEQWEREKKERKYMRNYGFWIIIFFSNKSTINLFFAN